MGRMSTKDKAIKLRATYESNIQKIKDDVALLKSVRRHLESTPIRISITLNTSSIKSDAAKAAAEYKKAFAAATAGGLSPGSSVSKGGIIVPASAAASVKEYAVSASSGFKSVQTSAGTLIQTFHQLEKGMVQINRMSKDGKSVSKSTVINTKPLEDFKSKLAQIERDFASNLGKSSGNKGAEAALLEEKKTKILAAMNHKDSASVRDTPLYQNADKSLDRLEKRIQSLRAGQSRTDSAEAQAQANKRAERFIAYSKTRTDRSLDKSAKEEISNAAEITGKVEREARMNQVLDAREKLLEKQIAQYRQLADIQRKQGFSTAADKYTGAANVLTGQLNQVRLDRTRARNLASREDNDHNLKQRLDHAIQYNNIRREELKNEEALAKAHQNRYSRENALHAVQEKRMALKGEVEKEVRSLRDSAISSGNRGVEAAAQSHLASMDKTAVADMRRLSAATTNSGHAFNFHTSSMLKNAMTFAQWYIPAQATMGVFSALGKGISGAVEAQRTFKILSVVYQGSTEDSKLLADQTLMLAAANGRNTDEAAQSAVAWARMGLTRTQILMAVESSLRAANVAEVSAAEATAYLTANYKAFGQTIADIPATLDFINALSNKNAVAPKQIFEGLARGGVIAKQAGIEIQSLASIIATVAATTQRPGAEIGNSIKTAISRLQRPQVAKDLKSQFGYEITTETGEAKKMEQVLTELSELYPKLGVLEQGRLRNMVAGATQGNRFAIVMETWGEKLLAQADAANAANSAMIENAAILDTVDAKLEKLSTTWTQAWHRMGESGLFDWMGNVLTDATSLLDVMMRIGNAGSSVSSGGGENPSGKSLSWLEKHMISFHAAGERMWDKFHGVDPQQGNASREELQSFIDNFKGTLFDSVASSVDSKLNGDKGLIQKDRFASLASTSELARGTINSATAQQDWFNYASNVIGKRGMPIDRLIEQFDHATASLAGNPIPGINAGDIRKNILPLLQNGDVAGAKQSLAATSVRIGTSRAELTAKAEAQRISSEKEVNAALEEQGKNLADLKQQFTDTGDSDAQKKIQKDINVTTDAVKTLKDTLKTLKNEMPKAEISPLAGYEEGLKKFYETAKKAGDVYGGLLSRFGNTGFANLDSKLKLGGAMVEQQILQTALDRKQAEFSTLDSRDYGRITDLMPPGAKPNDEVLALRKGISDRAELLSHIGENLDKVRVANEDLPRNNEMERQAELLHSVYQDTRTRTGLRFSGYDIGMSEGQRIASHTSGALNELGGAINASGTGSSTQQAQELATLTESLTQSKQGLFDMEKRLYAATADRKNLEITISEEMRKQNEEAGRRLAMASREDQLRAAAAAATLKQRGQSQFSMQEFQFFDQNTRNAISNFDPRLVKGLDSSERDQNESRNKLDREIAGLSISLQSMRRLFDDLQPKAENAGGGYTDIANPYASKTTTAADVLTNGTASRMNLNLGPINIDIDFSRHVQGIIDAVKIPFDTKLDTVLQNVRSMLLNAAGPNTSPAMGAW